MYHQKGKEDQFIPSLNLREQGDKIQKHRYSNK